MDTKNAQSDNELDKISSSIQPVESKPSEYLLFEETSNTSTVMDVMTKIPDNNLVDAQIYDPESLIVSENVISVGQNVGEPVNEQTTDHLIATNSKPNYIEDTSEVVTTSADEEQSQGTSEDLNQDMAENEAKETSEVPNSNRSLEPSQASSKVKDENLEISSGFEPGDWVFERTYNLRKQQRSPIIESTPVIKEKRQRKRTPSSDTDGVQACDVKRLKHEVVTDKNKCNICDMEFDTSQALNLHKNRHLSNRYFNCAFCEEIFDTNEELVSHKSDHSNENFLCMKCKKAYSDPLQYISHLALHLKTTPYKCFECKCSYDKLNSLRSHLAVHFSGKVECEICKREFLKHRLSSHLSKHRKVACIECGTMLTNDKHSIDYHMSVHTGVKKYQCLYCGKGFRNISAQRVHTRIHTNTRLYKCKLCPQSFVQSGDRTTHVARVHETPKYFECNECGKKYKDRPSLVVHMRLHTNYLPYKCPLCPKRFHSSTYLMHHTVTKHVKKAMYKCDICKVQYKYKTHLKRHYLSIIHQQKMYAANKDGSLKTQID